MKKSKGGVSKKGIAVILGLLLVGCSFHPARRVPVEGIEIESQSAGTLSIGEAKTYVDNEVLCVEGVINSTQGEHYDRRGTMSVTAIAKSGATLERLCGVFYSTEQPSGTYPNREHKHSARRFDIRLKSRLGAVSKLILVPLAADVECRSK